MATFFPSPRHCSPSAARFTSFSNAILVPSSSWTDSTSPVLPHPGRAYASSTVPFAGWKTPGLPTVAKVTWRQRMCASAARPCAIWPICEISARWLFTMVRSSRLATMSPERFAIAARTQARPMSIPTTQPARGFSSYRIAAGPRLPLALPPRGRDRLRGATRGPARRWAWRGRCRGRSGLWTRDPSAGRTRARSAR